MQLDHLSQGFFGYKKADVCQYITTLEEDYSRQLAALEESAKMQAADYQDRIQTLEQELLATKVKCETQMKEQLRISSTLLEAKHYAEMLRKEAKEKAEQERECWQKHLELKCRELARYQEQISSLHDMFHSLLHSMEEQTGVLLRQAQAIKETCPDRHMALFERTSDINADTQE